MDSVLSNVLKEENCKRETVMSAKHPGTHWSPAHGDQKGLITWVSRTLAALCLDKQATLS